MHRFEPEALWGDDGDQRDDGFLTSALSSAIVRSVSFHPLDHMVAFAAKKRVVVFKHRNRVKEEAESGESSTLMK